MCRSGDGDSPRNSVNGTGNVPTTLTSIGHVCHSLLSAMSDCHCSKSLAGVLARSNRECRPVTGWSGCRSAFQMELRRQSLAGVLSCNQVPRGRSSSRCSSPLPKWFIPLKENGRDVKSSLCRLKSRTRPEEPLTLVVEQLCIEDFITSPTRKF